MNDQIEFQIETPKQVLAQQEADEIAGLIIRAIKPQFKKVLEINFKKRIKESLNPWSTKRQEKNQETRALKNRSFNER